MIAIDASVCRAGEQPKAGLHPLGDTPLEDKDAILGSLFPPSSGLSFFFFQSFLKMERPLILSLARTLCLGPALCFASLKSAPLGPREQGGTDPHKETPPWACWGSGSQVLCSVWWASDQLPETLTCSREGSSPWLAGGAHRPPLAAGKQYLHVAVEAEGRHEDPIHMAEGCGALLLPVDEEGQSALIQVQKHTDSGPLAHATFRPREMEGKPITTLSLGYRP